MTTETKKTYRKGRLTVELDRSRVVPDDPGADTPAMVYGPNGSATYWCACGEGELIDREYRTIRLTKKELEWLESLDPELTRFLYD